MFCWVHFSDAKGGTYAYGYDPAYRLTSESRSGFRSYSASHTYDPMGNRLTRTLDGVTRSYTYNDADQVVSWTEGTKVGSYTYDADGNVVQKAVTDGGTPTDQWDYEFDSVGRMDNGQQSVGGSQSTANVYAGDQWYRVQSTTGGSTLKYGWRRDELFAEFDSSGQLTAGYLNDGVDRPYYKTRFSSGGTVVDGRDFYHGDANMRVHHLSDASGNLTEKYLYNAYGRRTILNPADDSVRSASAIGNRIGFQGREHEDLAGPGQEAGLTFHRNRFYDPDVGRWGRRDPLFVLARTPPKIYLDQEIQRIENQKNLDMFSWQSVYEYAHGNPLAYVDPKGLAAEYCYPKAPLSFTKWKLKKVDATPSPGKIGAKSGLKGLAEGLFKKLTGGKLPTKFLSTEFISYISFKFSRTITMKCSCCYWSRLSFGIYQWSETCKIDVEQISDWIGGNSGGSKYLYSGDIASAQAAFGSAKYSLPLRESASLTSAGLKYSNEGEMKTKKCTCGW